MDIPSRAATASPKPCPAWASMAATPSSVRDGSWWKSTSLPTPAARASSTAASAGGVAPAHAAHSPFARVLAGQVLRVAVDALRDPAIRFFTLREGGLLLGCGALKRIGADHGEAKSMRTADAALGRGVGRALLHHLVATARATGMTRLSLETGSTARSAAANRLYGREGFVRCGPFGAYADTSFTRFFTRAL
jgi:putative acetyltransferase